MAERHPKRKTKVNTVPAATVNRTIAQDHHEAIELPPLLVPKAFVGFVDFIRTQGVVGLAVGFIVGTAANTLVKSVVTNIFNPIIGLLTGGINLSQKSVCLNSVAGKCSNTLNYGQVISDIITFLIILFAVYVVIKGLKLDKLDKKKES
jgi:large conductance mechanosensitive channel